MARKFLRNMARALIVLSVLVVSLGGGPAYAGDCVNAGKVSINVVPATLFKNSTFTSSITATFEWPSAIPITPASCTTKPVTVSLSVESKKFPGATFLTSKNMGTLTPPPNGAKGVLQYQLNASGYISNLGSDDTLTLRVVATNGEDELARAQTALQYSAVSASPSASPRGSSQPGPAGKPVTSDFSIQNPLKITSFLELIKTITEWLRYIAIPIAVILIVYAGVLFLTAGAVPANVSHARTILKYVIIGLAVILIGSGFISLVESVLNLGADEPAPTQTTQP